MPRHAHRLGRSEHAPAASVDRPSSRLTGEPPFWVPVHLAPDRGAQRRTMQETLFVLCRGDVNGGNLLGSTTRRWGGTAEAGGLKPGAAFTSPSCAGRRLKSLPVGRSAPAREAQPSRPAPARQRGGARPRSRQPVRLSTACRVRENVRALEATLAAWRPGRERRFRPALGPSGLARPAASGGAAAA